MTVQELLNSSRCFAYGCVSRGQQTQLELSLLAGIAGYTGTVQELLSGSKCFSGTCLSEGEQDQIELAIYNAILGP